jgi:ATP-dependent DNA ligase
MIGMAKSDRTPRTCQRVELVPPPIWVKPQLAKPVEKAPDGPDWLHEIKFDGYRMHARLGRAARKPGECRTRRCGDAGSFG